MHKGAGVVAKVAAADTFKPRHMPKSLPSTPRVLVPKRHRFEGHRDAFVVAEAERQSRTNESASGCLGQHHGFGHGPQAPQFLERGHKLSLSPTVCHLPLPYRQSPRFRAATAICLDFAWQACGCRSDQTHPAANCGLSAIALALLDRQPFLDGFNKVFRRYLAANERIQYSLLLGAWRRQPCDPAVCGGDFNRLAAALAFLHADLCKLDWCFGFVHCF